MKIPFECFVFVGACGIPEISLQFTRRLLPVIIYTNLYILTTDQSPFMKGCLHENGGLYNGTRRDEDVRRYIRHDFHLLFNLSPRLRKSVTISC